MQRRASVHENKKPTPTRYRKGRRVRFLLLMLALFALGIYLVSKQPA